MRPSSRGAEADRSRHLDISRPDRADKKSVSMVVRGGGGYVGVHWMKGVVEGVVGRGPRPNMNGPPRRSVCSWCVRPGISGTRDGPGVLSGRVPPPGPAPGDEV